MQKIQNPDPSADYLIVRVVGGEQPGASFSQRVGPLKLNGKQVGESIKQLTLKDHRAQRVHVLLTVKDKKATCSLFPTTAQIIIRELKENREPKRKGGEKRSTLHNGSISIDQLFKIAAEVKDRSRSKTLRGTVKEVLGTAIAVGCFIDGKHPKEVTAAVKEGRHAVAELFGQDINTLPAFLDE